jgi:hypothetical protein
MSGPVVEAANVHFQRASLLFSHGRHAEAEAEYRHVVRLVPGDANAHNNLGNVLEVLDRHVDAETHIRMALALDPALPEAHYNLGSLARHAARIADAEAAWRCALALRPAYPDAAFSLATLLLASGRFEEGWRRYEARYDYPKFIHGQSRALLRCAQWNGESLTGKSLLVWQEDGLGDMIQFARYLPMLKAAGATRIVLGCVSGLHRLLAAVDGVDAVLDHDAAQAQAAEFDYWTSLLSAPLHFSTTMDTIPAPVRFHARDATPSRDFTAGLVWKGNPNHFNDANRSLPSLETLAPLWSVPDARFVSLQKGALNSPLPDAVSSAADLADTAAVIAGLDLVISVDTSIAHLAASMGKPCWVLLPARDTDWRWMHDRDDSPWYPGTVRLFRQQRHEAWPAVIERVRQALTVRHLFFN